jgi:hypothetical protein
MWKLSASEARRLKGYRLTAGRKLQEELCVWQRYGFVTGFVNQCAMV